MQLAEVQLQAAAIVTNCSLFPRSFLANICLKTGSAAHIFFFKIFSLYAKASKNISNNFVMQFNVLRPVVLVARSKTVYYVIEHK
jgi:hypothetical protein